MTSKKIKNHSLTIQTQMSLQNQDLTERKIDLFFRGKVTVSKETVFL